MRTPAGTRSRAVGASLRTSGSKWTVHLRWGVHLAVLVVAWRATSSRPLGLSLLWASIVSGLILGVASARPLWGRDPFVLARAAALLVTSVAVVLALAPRTTDVFQVAKYTVVVCAGVVLASVWVAEVAWRRATFMRPRGVETIVCASLAWAAVTTATSVSRTTSVIGDRSSFDGLAAAAAGALIFLTAVRTFAMPDLRVVLASLSLASAIPVLTYGFVQLHDTLHVPGETWDWVRWLSEGWLTFSTLGNPNHLGALLAMLVPIEIVLAMTSPSRWPRAGFGMIALLSTVLLFVTFSSGAWLAGVAAAVVLMAMGGRDLRPAARPLAAAAVVAVVLLASAGIRFHLGSFVAREAKALVTGDWSSTLAQRERWWAAAARMGVERPVHGWGPDTYSILYPRFQTRWSVGAIAEKDFVNGPHNSLLNRLANQGIPGAVLWIAVVIAGAMHGPAAWLALRRRRRRGDGLDPSDRDASLLVAGTTAALAAFVTSSMFNVEQIALSTWWWVLLGAIVGCARTLGVPSAIRPSRLLSATAPAEPAVTRVGGERTRAERKAEQYRAGAAARLQHGIVFRVAVLAAAGPLLVYAAWVATAPLRADRVYVSAAAASRRAQRLENTTDSADLMRSARSLALRAEAINGWEPVYAASAGLANVTLAQSTSRASETRRLLLEARADYLRAVSKSPLDPRILEPYADVHVRLWIADGRGESWRPEAIRALTRALESDPWLVQPRVTLVELLADHRPADARRVLAEGLRLLPDDTTLLEARARLDARLASAQASP